MIDRLKIRELIAEAGHKKWLEAQQAKGVVYGKERTATTHPHCLPWDDLVLDERTSDYMAAEAALDVFSEWKAVYLDFSGNLQRAQID